MQKEYNWKAINFGAIPMSIAAFFIFNSSMGLGWKRFYLIIAMAIAIGITYYFDKKKHNIFTTPFIVLIVALATYGLKNLGLI